MKLSELPGNSYALGGADRVKHRGMCYICGAKGHKSKACDLLGAEHCEPMPRCRCGLMLPCDDCLPVHAAEFAAKRMISTQNLATTRGETEAKRIRGIGDRHAVRVRKAHAGSEVTLGGDVNQRLRGLSNT